jgi:hypothetical protein
MVAPATHVEEESFARRTVKAEKDLVTSSIAATVATRKARKVVMSS